jgi:hypothetical protein
MRNAIVHIMDRVVRFSGPHRQRRCRRFSPQDATIFIQRLDPGGLRQSADLFVTAGSQHAAQIQEAVWR